MASSDTRGFKTFVTRRQHTLALVVFGLFFAGLLAGLIYYVVNRNREKKNEDPNPNKSPEKQARDDTVVYIVVGSVLFLVFVAVVYAAVKRGKRAKSDSDVATNSSDATTAMDKEAKDINMEKIRLDEEFVKIESSNDGAAQLQTQFKLLESNFLALNKKIEAYNSRSGDFGKLKKVDIGKMKNAMNLASLEKVSKVSSRNSRRVSERNRYAKLLEFGKETEEKMKKYMDEGNFDKAEEAMGDFNERVYTEDFGSDYKSIKPLTIASKYTVERFKKLRKNVEASLKALGDKAREFDSAAYKDAEEMVDTYNSRVNNFERLGENEKTELKLSVPE